MKKFKKLGLYIISLLLACLGLNWDVFAENATEYGIGMSPLNQKIVLKPGETYNGSFLINNPASHDLNFDYKIAVKPFYVDENYEIYYDQGSSYNQITDWITLGETEGTLKPNEKREIAFRVDVPENAPAGGQYAAIAVSSKPNDTSGENEALNIIVTQTMAHIIYAEVAGTTVRSGEVTDASVPGFLLSGNISGISSVKNTGNVHETATYTLQVFPLFSDEEVYTNEEYPQEMTVLPDRTLVNTTSWDGTPEIGIFNVKYKVNFSGQTAEVNKTVIKCPVWLLAIVIFALAALIVWISVKIKDRKKAKK